MRSVSATFLTAQQAATNTPYAKLMFWNKALTVSVDLSSDSPTYGNRILLIDHTEEPYDDYATIILRNQDRSIPQMKGYRVEIGYGYTVAGVDHYLGDATNEPAPAFLWVKHQQNISAGGKLWCLLELEGMWSKLRELLIRLGSPPLYTKSYTTDTIFTIIGLILAEGGFTLNTLVENDGIISSLQPQFDINAQPFEYANSIIYRLLNMTASYLKARGDKEFEIKFPASGDAVNLTFYSDAAPYFYEYLERINVLIPNHFIVYGNEGTDERWASYIASGATHGIDQSEIDAYGDVYRIVLAGSLTTQAQVDSRADSLMARAKFEALAGKMYAPHEARLELYDKIAVKDRRGI